MLHVDRKSVLGMLPGQLPPSPAGHAFVYSRGANPRMYRQQSKQGTPTPGLFAVWAALEVVPSQSPANAVYERLQRSRAAWLSLFATAASTEGYELNHCHVRTYETGGDGIRFPPPGKETHNEGRPDGPRCRHFGPVSPRNKGATVGRPVTSIAFVLLDKVKEPAERKVVRQGGHPARLRPGGAEAVKRLPVGVRPSGNSRTS